MKQKPLRLLRLVTAFLVWNLLPLSTMISGTNGILEGVVRDRSSQQGLPGASVLIVGTQLGASTDVNGAYAINNIPAGVYTVRCSFVGYQSTLVKDVVISPDLKTKLTIEISSSAVELNAVEVNAERPPIQKDVTGTVYSVNEKSIAALPVSSLQELIGLQPGVTLENNIRGGKTTEVVYLVDGLPVQNLIDGGLGSELPQSSIGDISVQTGGFDPEYGNALSGVVNIVTKRGGESHVINTRFEKDDLFGGKEVDHRNELELSAGGPVTQDVRYFADLHALFTDTQWWQDFRRSLSSPIERTYDGFAKVDYFPSQSLRVSGQFLYSNKTSHDYEFSWRFNLPGLPSRKQEGSRAAVIISHTLTPALFYTASISRYSLTSDINEGPKDGVDTTIYTWDFFLQYIVGGNRSWWARKEQIQNVGKYDLTWRMNEHHLFKAGAEFNLQEINADILRYEPQVNTFGKPFVNKPLLDYSTDYRYFPRSGSAYVQDKIELSKDGMLLNLGMRYEFLDPRARRPLAERTVDQNNQYQTTIVGSSAAKVKNLLSPRIGFAAPFAENGYLFINYGQYYQFPLFDYLYSGLNNVSLKKGVGVLVGNPDLKPEVTRSWEMSLKYALQNGLVLSSTYFHKETENQIDVKTFIPTNARIAGDYGFAEFVNNPFATSNGVELVFSKDNGKVLNGSVSYTYMVAEGVSENAREGLQYYQWGIPAPAIPFPLSWDQRHTVKVIAQLQLPSEILAVASWLFYTGRPYTYFPSKDGFTPLDSLAEFEPNNARMPDYNLLNIKLSKKIDLGSAENHPYTLTVYIDLRNAFNARNVRWMDSSGRIGGELGDITAWDSYRRLHVGVKFTL